MPKIFALLAAACFLACSAAPQSPGAESTKTVASADSLALGFEMSSGTAAYMPVTDRNGNAVYKSQYACWLNEFRSQNPSASYAEVGLETQSDGQYGVFISPQGFDGDPVIVGIQCEPWSSLTVGAPAWFGGWTQTTAYNTGSVGGTATATPQQASRSNSFCPLVGVSTPSAGSSDMCEVIPNGTSWLLYDQIGTDPPDSGKRHFCASSCDNWNAPLPLQGPYVLDATHHSVALPSNSLCGLTRLIGGFQGPHSTGGAYNAGVYVQGSTAFGLSGDGVHWPTAWYYCLPLF